MCVPGFWREIYAARMQSATAKDTSKDEPKGNIETFCFEDLNGICRTGWPKTAAGTDKRANAALVAADEEYEHGSYHDLLFFQKKTSLYQNCM